MIESSSYTLLNHTKFIQNINFGGSGGLEIYHSNLILQNVLFDGNKAKY